MNKTETKTKVATPKGATPKNATPKGAALKIAEYLHNNANARRPITSEYLTEMRKAIKPGASDKAAREKLSATDSGTVLLGRYEAFAQRAAKSSSKKAA